MVGLWGMLSLACVAMMAECAVVQELKFIADAKELQAAEGGVVVVGLFGSEDKAEKKGFMQAAKSTEFQDKGWNVAWSGEAKILEHFEASTPSMIVYRLFDEDGVPCEPRQEV